MAARKLAIEDLPVSMFLRRTLSYALVWFVRILTSTCDAVL